MSGMKAEGGSGNDASFWFVMAITQALILDIIGEVLTKCTKGHIYSQAAKPVLIRFCTLARYF